MATSLNYFAVCLAPILSNFPAHTYEREKMFSFIQIKQSDRPTVNRGFIINERPEL
jgi:hypothetical protein